MRLRQWSAKKAGNAAVASRKRRTYDADSRTFRKRAMYENLTEEVVTDENCALALAAVKRN
jgi:hypothetical protein